MSAPDPTVLTSARPEGGAIPPGRLARRAARTLLLLAVSWTALETASCVGLWLRDGVPPSPARWRAERRRALGEASAAAALTRGVQERGSTLLHPFLGFTTERRDQWGESFVVDELGFVQKAGPEQGAGDEFVIGVFGGSVAQLLALHHGELLASIVQGAPALAGRRVRVVDLAMGGYKQPQQLMTLVWTQAYGARLDAAVLLDGFNDVALPEAENRGTRVHPFYPRGWRSLVEATVGPGRLLAAGELAQLERRRRRQARWCARPVLSWSPACHLLWSAADSRLQARGAALRRGLEAAAAGTAPGALGPPRPPGGARRRARTAAEFWGRCAVLMRQICAERGIVFVHFLQPNQYVAGSKPMGAEERRVALSADSGYGAAAAIGYPELQRVGRELRAAGEPFTDLTAMFSAVEAPVYTDNCCHFNDLGATMVAREIGTALVREIERRRAAGGEVRGPAGRAAG